MGFQLDISTSFRISGPNRVNNENLNNRGVDDKDVSERAVSDSVENKADFRRSMDDQKERTNKRKALEAQRNDQARDVSQRKNERLEEKLSHREMDKKAKSGSHWTTGASRAENDNDTPNNSFNKDKRINTQNHNARPSITTTDTNVRDNQRLDDLTGTRFMESVDVGEIEPVLMDPAAIPIPLGAGEQGLNEDINSDVKENFFVPGLIGFNTTRLDGSQGSGLFTDSLGADSSNKNHLDLSPLGSSTHYAVLKGGLHGQATVNTGGDPLLMALGSQALGSQALGSQALGSQALGSQGLGVTHPGAVELQSLSDHVLGDKLSLLGVLNTGSADQIKQTLFDKFAMTHRDESSAAIVDEADTPSALNDQGLGLKSLSQAASSGVTNGRLQIPVNITFGQPQWSQAIAERTAAIASQKITMAELKLDPPELGPLTVKVHVQQEQVVVNFVTNSSAVKDSLDDASHRLKALFEEQGMNLVDVDVSHRDSDENGSDENGSKESRVSGADEDQNHKEVGSNQTLSMDLGVDDFA